MHSFMITHLEVPENDAEAWDWIESLDESSDQPDAITEPKLLALIDFLLTQFPENYPDEEWEKCVWAEGPMYRCGNDNVLWVSVSGRLLDKGVQKFLVDSARSFGLVSFNTESNEIIRP